ncbi:ComF family protein [Arenibaculum pallidiluteum]|uniref:ComF family protein n=1 Tax=Arenibaculum pallidiluteum TaxID=2812559 RepID=UPI001A978AEC|nr:ComF family protein [Arenibaculum pallidiluteum]
MVAVSRIAAPARRVLDLLLPPRCLGCGVRVHAQGTLCAACWAGLSFLAPPWCACCGLPFTVDPGSGDALCGACLAEPPAFARARAALAYDDASRGLVLGFKHADRTHAAPAFGAWMARAGAGVLDGADLLVPVPLHRWRLFRRRYNQAALLARALARLTGVPAAPDLLARRRATPSQGTLGREARRRNVAGAVAVRRGRADAVKGRRIVLVDDVLTTGATLSECARVLLRAGAAQVDALALARVVRDG